MFLGVSRAPQESSCSSNQDLVGSAAARPGLSQAGTMRGERARGERATDGRARDERAMSDRGASEGRARGEQERRARGRARGQRDASDLEERPKTEVAISRAPRGSQT